MRLVALALGLAVLAGPAFAAPKSAPADPKPFLEGEWHGVTVDTNANKLCTKESPQAAVFTFEFQTSGGVALFNDGNEGEGGHRKIQSAAQTGNLIDIQLEGQLSAFTFRKDGPNLLTLVRDSASLGMPVDVMVFKRCKPAADRSAIQVDAAALETFAAEMPGDLPYFVDARIAAKTPDACGAPKVQYMFFGLLGPSELRMSRWNSFDLADDLSAKKKPAFPLDAVGDWAILSAASKDGAVTMSVRDYEKPDAAPVTLTLQPKGPGRVAIPEWGREYVRCKGLNKRS
jgi:hypothetical protein